jgi:hypothetical protein
MMVNLQTGEESSKRVAILTQPLDNNYGGILQAYALVHVLRALGCDPIVIDRRSQQKISLKRKLVNCIKYKFLCKYMKWLSPVLRFKPDHKTVSQNTENFIKKYIPRSKCIYSTEMLRRICTGKFDAYIVGSDQVWRPCYSPCLTNFFLDFLSDDPKTRRVSYAASFGAAEWELTKEETIQCRALAQRFHAVSVREDSAVHFCEHYLNVHAEHVLDPTLLLTRNDYLKLLPEEEIKSKSLFVYILDDDFLKKKVVSRVGQILSLSPFRVEAKPFETNDFFAVDEYIVPPVENWIAAFRDAEYIVTDSFHGCVFSIIFKKDFLVIGNLTRGMARFSSLLKMFSLENRLVTDWNDLTEEKIKSNIDWKKVEETLEQKKASSLDFLMKNLIRTC